MGRVNYWETYALVVNWISVRFLLILSEIVGLESQAINFVLCISQAELDVPVYMELPVGMEVEGTVGDRRQYVLRLRKSLYGLKQASANWYDVLKTWLQHRGFHKSVADPCVFIKSAGSQNPSTGSTETTCDHHTNEHTHDSYPNRQILLFWYMCMTALFSAATNY